MRKLRLLTLAVVVLTVAVAAPAQTYTVLDNLGTYSGDTIEPTWSGQFAQARDGNLYSTSQAGGANGLGTVFQLTPTGTETVLHSFASSEGRPYGGLTLSNDGNLYGITVGGGSAGWGSVYKISTGGTFTVVHSFNGTTEGTPWYGNAAPIQAANGSYYGTASDGNGAVFGTVYKMTAAGVMTVLYTFNGTNRYPYAIVQGADGSFYGTAGYGTTGSNGIVFKITAAGKFTVLHNFAGYPNDGAVPAGSIMQASDGNFYGTTERGGANNYGTIYKMTPKGVVTILHSFNFDTLGFEPFAGLIQATDGKFYGAATGGGTAGGGILFQATSAGSYSVLFGLTGTIGAYPGHSPQLPLFQHTNGTLYGDTVYGGSGTVQCGTALNCGVLYSLNMGLNPFVALMTTSGKSGQVIEILGNGLTGTTSVLFGSGSASFKVVSDTYMTATVPATGTSGPVTVNAPSGIRVSSKNFKVLPVISGFSPPSGAVGTQVVITGKGLTQTATVTIGGVKATIFTVNSATQVTATVPTGAKTGKIAITTQGGTATSATSFLVTPQITTFTPTSGPVGTSVTITGVSLSQATKVTFGGVAATSFKVNSDTQVTATVPTGAVTGPIEITTPGGTAQSATNFTVQ